MNRPQRWEGPFWEDSCVHENVTAVKKVISAQNNAGLPPLNTRRTTNAH